MVLWTSLNVRASEIFRNVFISINPEKILSNSYASPVNWLYEGGHSMNHGTLIQGKALHFIQYIWKTLDLFPLHQNLEYFQLGRKIVVLNVCFDLLNNFIFLSQTLFEEKYLSSLRKLTKTLSKFSYAVKLHWSKLTLTLLIAETTFCLQHQLPIHFMETKLLLLTSNCLNLNGKYKAVKAQI